MWGLRRVLAGIGSSACLFLTLDAVADEPRYPAPRLEPELYTLLMLPSGPMGGFSRYLGGMGVGLRATASPLSRGIFGDADDRIGIFGGLALASIWGQAISVTANANGIDPYTTYEDDSTASFLLFPFGLRWLLPLSSRVSVFLEPGGLASVRLHSLPLLPRDQSIGVSPTGALGVQVFVSRHIAFTLRGGYPMLLTIGLSASP